MTVLSATELKTRLGQCMDLAQTEPVVVRKSGRDYAVLISQAEFERYQALEDRYWGERAEAGRQSGYLTPEETAASIRRRLDAIEAREG